MFYEFVVMEMTSVQRKDVMLLYGFFREVLGIVLREV
jgi:hypothetical protein